MFFDPSKNIRDYQMWRVTVPATLTEYRRALAFKKTVHIQKWFYEESNDKHCLFLSQRQYAPLELADFKAYLVGYHYILVTCEGQPSILFLSKNIPDMKWIERVVFNKRYDYIT